MPGLINRTSSSPLPLTASEVTSCVSGYAFGMTASLTYGNPEAHPFEGLFVYPLDEYTTVVGFEAVVSRRAVTVQIKDKAKIDDCYLDCGSLPNGRAQDGSGRIALDEDLERIAFVANLGVIPALESVSVFISTSSELQTLPSGAVRVLLPAVCVPKVPQCGVESTSLSGHQLRADRHSCAAGSPDPANKFCLAQLLESEATNLTEYEFSFHLEIRGPCVLAGVESPTHEIRADADPSARSAKSIVITLANKHTFDRPVEILIHPSEPHMPHVLMEEGDMTPTVYEQHLKGRNDFIKGTKKDPSAEKKLQTHPRRTFGICQKSFTKRTALWSREHRQISVSLWSEASKTTDFSQSTRNDQSYPQRTKKLMRLEIYRTGDQCREWSKWLKTKYLKTRNHNCTSGSSLTLCLFCDEFDQVLGTASSTKATGGAGSPGQDGALRVPEASTEIDGSQRWAPNEANEVTLLMKRIPEEALPQEQLQHILGPYSVELFHAPPEEQPATEPAAQTGESE